MGGKFWTITADLLGLALLAAMLAGGTKTTVFAALLLAAPIGFACLFAMSSTAHDA